MTDPDNWNRESMCQKLSLELTGQELNLPIIPLAVDGFIETAKLRGLQADVQPIDGYCVSELEDKALRLLRLAIYAARCKCYPLAIWIAGLAIGMHADRRDRSQLSCYLGYVGEGDCWDFAKNTPSFVLLMDEQEYHPVYPMPESFLLPLAYVIIGMKKN